MKSMMLGRHTAGEVMAAGLMGAVAAVFAAVAGYFAGAWVSWQALRDPESLAPIVWGLLAAMAAGLVGFVLVFRWVLRYGDTNAEP